MLLFFRLFQNFEESAQLNDKFAIMVVFQINYPMKETHVKICLIVEWLLIRMKFRVEIPHRKRV